MAEDRRTVGSIRGSKRGTKIIDTVKRRVRRMTSDGGIHRNSSLFEF